MKTAVIRKKKTPPTFEEEDCSAFGEYAGGGGEAALGRAYELGRRAIAEKKSLMEIASLHHQSLQGMLAEAESAGRQQALVSAAAGFVSEVLSPYEMAHRGVQDAIGALRQLNETLEEEIKRIAYAGHDDAGQLLVAVHLALDEVAPDLPKVKQEQLGQIEGLLKQAEKHLRRNSHRIRPTSLYDLVWVSPKRAL